jgi:hypothetical protein
VNRLFITAICLLLFFNGALAQLVKLPQLFTHFLEHRQEDPALGISDFVVMHYIGDDNKDSDNDRDRELPFKKYDDSSSFDVEAVYENHDVGAVIFSMCPAAKSGYFYVETQIDAVLSSDHRPPIFA